MKIVNVYQFNSDNDFITNERLQEILRQYDGPIPPASPALFDENTGEYYLLNHIKVNSQE